MDYCSLDALDTNVSMLLASMTSWGRSFQSLMILGRNEYCWVCLSRACMPCTPVLAELRSCAVKVEVAVLGSTSLIVLKKRYLWT